MASKGQGIRKQYLHTVYQEATNATGNNVRGYINSYEDINYDVTGIPTVRKRILVALFWYYLECYFTRFYVLLLTDPWCRTPKCENFNKCYNFLLQIIKKKKKKIEQVISRLVNLMFGFPKNE